MKTQEDTKARIDELAKKKNERIAELESEVQTLKDRIGPLEAYNQNRLGLIEDNKNLQKQLEGFQKLKESLAEILPSQTVGTPRSAKNLTITESKLHVELKNTDPIVKQVNVETGDGKVLWALFKAEKPLATSEIMDSLAEAGRPIKQTTLAPTLGGLVKDGWVIKEGNTKGVVYRLPRGIVYKEK